MNPYAQPLILLYGSTTGATEGVAQAIARCFQEEGLDVELHDVAFFPPQTLSSPPPLILLGASTWYYGELQSDWKAWAPHLAPFTDWKGQPVALFGCGDQEGYPEYFCDALGILYHSFLKPLETRLVGQTSLEGYCFTRSKALASPDCSLGLMVDEHLQPELTSHRIRNWVQSLLQEVFHPLQELKT